MTKQNEIIPLAEMLPTKFQPKKTYNFLFNLKGIDAFLVKEVYLHPWVYKRWPLSLFQSKRGLISVWLHDPVAPSSSLQIDHIIKKERNKSRTAQLKFLDPIGTLVSLRNFYDVRIEKYECKKFTYEGGEFCENYVILSYGREDLEF